MTNYGAKILNNAVSALAAQQAVIATTGNNIANVNTDGYVRRQATLQSRVSAGRSSGINVGNGVEVGEIRRIADAFLESLVLDGSSDKFDFGVQDEFLDRVERLYDLTGGVNTVGKTLTEFFSAFDNLSLDPSSIELRADVMARAETLVTSIQETYGGLASLQDEADQRIAVEVNTINSLTSQIAVLNGLIGQRESTGTVAADERDQRDKLLLDLSEKISFNWREEQDGSVTVTLDSGFTLVNSINTRNLEVTENPDFAPGALPQDLSGGLLSYVVYDYDPSVAGTAHFDLTQELLAGGGVVGGLLKVRGYADPANVSPFEATGPLVEMAARVEALTQTLLVDFNQRYLGPDRGDVVGVWSSTAGDLNGNVPGVFGFFTVPGTPPLDFDADGQPTLADLANMTLVDNFQNFSSLLGLTHTDPSQIAASRHDEVLNPSPAPLSFPQGDASNITGDANLPGISQLQAQAFNYTIGTFTLNNSTFDELYNESVGRIGNLKNRSRIEAAVSEDNFISVMNRRDELSAVSLDEEFTALIRFQKAFEANARMVRTADELLQQIVQLI